MINSNNFIEKLTEIGISQAEIKDLFTYRYNIDYNQVLTGRLYMMPEKAEMDIEVLKRGYPSAYILGFVNFFGMKINVTNKVLIPRPETEELVTIIMEQNKRTLVNTALDLCTGSGCIALSLKKIFPHAKVYASDISPYAIQVAQNNAEENKLEIYLAISNYLEYFVKQNIKVDYIACNPPYIPNNATLDKSLSYEPQIALFGGPDGLDAYRMIFKDLDTVLIDHGVAIFEVESTLAQDIVLLAKESLPRFSSEIIKDMSGKERFIKFSKNVL
ncbi:MAG: peptide chain release factor N(5)-glutamine methyltransferase [Bacilli bacterium]